MSNSNFLSLNKRDIINGIIVSCGGALTSSLMEAFNDGNFNWASIGKAALCAGLAYLSKNVFTNASGSLFKK